MEENKNVEVPQEEVQEKKELTEEQKKAWVEFLQRRRANLIHVAASRKVKSINRAVKRNRITPQGDLKSGRPFNNRANTSSRKGVHSRVHNEAKKKLYETFKRFTAKQSV